MRFSNLRFVTCINGKPPKSFGFCFTVRHRNETCSEWTLCFRQADPADFRLAIIFYSKGHCFNAVFGLTTNCGWCSIFTEYYSAAFFTVVHWILTGLVSGAFDPKEAHSHLFVGARKQLIKLQTAMQISVQTLASRTSEYCQKNHFVQLIIVVDYQ